MLLATVGTSLLNNLVARSDDVRAAIEPLLRPAGRTRLARRDRLRPEDFRPGDAVTRALAGALAKPLARVHLWSESTLRRLSAETATFAVLPAPYQITRGHAVVLLPTSTAPSVACALALEAWLQREQVEATVDPIPALAIGADLEQGLARLVDIAVEHIRAARHEGRPAVLCATGGLKVQAAYLAVVALLMQTECFYLHEDDHRPAVTALPLVPVAIDFARWDLSRALLTPVLGPRAPDRERALAALPPALRGLLVLDRDLIRPSGLLTAAEDKERRDLIELFRRSNGKIASAARALGITKSALSKRAKLLGMPWKSLRRFQETSGNQESVREPGPKVTFNARAGR